jgi:serine/threonine-protein kinase
MTINWAEIRLAALGQADSNSLPPKINLPVLPRILTEFNRKADNPEAAPRELSTLIETDTGLTCELLRYANSAFMGLRTKASTAHQALSMLGIRQTKLFLLSAGLRLALAAQQSKLINLKNFWNANLERALFAREVARLLHADADLAFAGGMLQDLLLPALTNELIDDYQSFLRGQETSPRNLIEFEREEFGWTHAVAAARLIHDWHFPDDLACCLLYHHQGLEMLCDPRLGKTAVAAVAVAGLVPDAFHQSPHGFEQLLHLETVWPEFDLESIAARVQDEFSAMSPGASHPFSLLHYCQRNKAAAAC